MHTSLVMTLIGRDRPGLVERVATLVADRGGNWLESRMCHLGGQFAGILRIQVPMEQEADLLSALEGLAAEGLSVVAHADRDQAAAGQPTACLEVVGQDRPGIVRQITHALARKGVNVEELHTECVSAAMSGETLFKARAKLRIPATCALPDLRAELECIASDLLVDVSLVRLNTGA